MWIKEGSYVGGWARIWPSETYVRPGRGGVLHGPVRSSQISFEIIIFLVIGGDFDRNPGSLCLSSHCYYSCRECGFLG